MDFKELVNKESFKAILLHHLKSQTKQRLGNVISNKLKENVSSMKNSTSESIVDDITKDVLESEDFHSFLSSFLNHVDILIEDKDSYVPKDEKRDNVSQCSSASSLNTSSIDFLSPDQFQSTIYSLKTGTNAEKLEALETLHRLPTLEHLTNKAFWSDAEIGLHDSLLSNVVFLRTAAMKLFIKMLTSSESKIVLDSYLSFIKYMHRSLLPHLSQYQIGATFIDNFRSSVEVVAVLNKFLQMISGHWLRYPQSVIENISAQSLSIFSDYKGKRNAFPVWTCFACCDPEAKWVKNILYGHLSRAAFLIALENDPSILEFCVTFCSNLISEKCLPNFVCCQNSVFISEITHILSFLSYLLQYYDGRKVFDSKICGGIISGWSEALEIIMKSSNVLCEVACINCCLPVFVVISSAWSAFWNQDINLASHANLLKILVSTFSEMGQKDSNLICFAIQCLSCSFLGIVSTSVSTKLNLNLEHLVVTLLTYCAEFSLNSFPESASIDWTYLYIQRYLLALVKNILSTPSSLFLNCEFTRNFCIWWQKINENNLFKMLPKIPFENEVSYNNIVESIEQNLLDVNIALLSKPCGIVIIQDLSKFESTLNILLEKLLKDIKTKRSVCCCDVATLSAALNCRITLENVLNRTIVFRLSSIIWQLIEVSDCDNFYMVKGVLEMLMPSIFCDVVNMDLLGIGDLEDNKETLLLHSVLLSPKLTEECLVSEEYGILALNVLALLTTSVHAVCCLEAKYSLSEFILEQQLHRVTLEGNPVIDLEYVLRNYILVKIYALGGPGERILPEEDLVDCEDYQWWLRDSIPVPEIFYIPLIVPTESKLEQGTISLASVIESNEEIRLQETFLNYLKLNDMPSNEFCFQVFNLSSNTFNIDIESLKNPNSIPLESEEYLLNEEELVGLSLIKRYGSLLNRTTTVENGKLQQILKAAKRLTKSNKIDIFVCTIYLMCCEDIDLAWSFLRKFSKTPNAFLIWPALFSNMEKNMISKAHSVILEMCDLVVKKSLPHVFSIFKLFGVLPSALFNYWMAQCFWNYLDFGEISNLILLNVLYSGMFSIYFFISVMKHLQSYILSNSHNCSLMTDLKKNPIKNYKMQHYIDYIMELSLTFSYMEPLLKNVN